MTHWAWSPSDTAVRDQIPWAKGEPTVLRSEIDLGGQEPDGQWIGRSESCRIVSVSRGLSRDDQFRKLEHLFIKILNEQPVTTRT